MHSCLCKRGGGVQLPSNSWEGNTSNSIPQYTFCKGRGGSSSIMFDNLITPCILSPLTSSVYTHCTQCDSSCLTLGTHWALGTHTGCTQQASILLSLAFLNITQDFKNLDSGQKKIDKFFCGWQNQETTKPWNHKTTKPWNLSLLHWLRDGVGETMQPRNRETYPHLNDQE